MLGSLAIVCASLWVLGLATSNTMGGFIHVLVVAATVLFLIRFFRQPHTRPYGRARRQGRGR